MGNSLSRGICPNCGTLINTWDMECSGLMACANCGWCNQVIKPAYKQANVPLFTLQPLSAVTAAKGGTATDLVIEVSTIGVGAITYQWYSNTTNTVVGASLISGATDATYTPPVTTGGIKYYFCKATNTEFDEIRTADSEICTYTVSNAPTITTDVVATATTAKDGVATQLSIVATVTGNTMTYQWYSNTVESDTGATVVMIADAELAAYTPPVAIVGVLYYFCKVTNALYVGGGTTTSGLCAYTVTA